MLDLLARLQWCGAMICSKIVSIVQKNYRTFGHQSWNFKKVPQFPFTGDFGSNYLVFLFFSIRLWLEVQFESFFWIFMEFLRY